MTDADETTPGDQAETDPDPVILNTPSGATEFTPQLALGVVSDACKQFRGTGDEIDVIRAALVILDGVVNPPPPPNRATRRTTAKKQTAKRQPAKRQARKR
jgi:hypothetical protein